MNGKFMLWIVVMSLSIFSLFLAHMVLTEYLNKKDLGDQNSTDERRETSTMTTPFQLKEDLINAVEKQFKTRKNRIDYICNTYVDLPKYKSVSNFKKAVSNVIIDMKHNLTWCPIYKAASSMWMKNFAALSGFPTKESIMSTNHVDDSVIVKQKFQHSDAEEKLKQINSTITFMVVRHPFERLLSAYRDKLEHMQNREYYYKHYGKYIRNKYRATHSNLTSLEPSFEEFLQYIAKEKIFDEHWVPFFDSCQPCSIEYDYILKFESLKDEYNVFIRKNNLDSDLKYIKNNRKSTSSQGITDDLVSTKYFQDIPETLLYQIFKIYELDFLLFSYNPAKYYYMSVH